MSGTSSTGSAVGPDVLEEALRAIGAERYHDKHPFHRALHGGTLTFGQVQAWALNRYCYQAAIPAKDASLLARLPTPELRREWRSRLEDHDGRDGDPGGIARWLALCEGLGLDRDYVVSMEGALAGTRFAVEAYVRWVRERSVLEAVASSLTEMFSPALIAERVAGMLRHYPFVDEAKLAYFLKRPPQAGRDSAFALDYVKREALTAEAQAAVLDSLRFKCDVLWSQLDALHYAYVEPGHIPPGAYRPG